MGEIDAGQIIGELLGVNAMTPAQLAAVQDGRLRKLLAQAKDASPFYRRVLAGRDVADVSLEEMPVMTKSDMMAHFDEIVTDPQLRRAGVESFLADRDNVGRKHLGRYVVLQSSGTTGEAAFMVYDELGLAYFSASAMVARRPVPSGLGPMEQFMVMQDYLAKGRRIRLAYVIVTSGHMSTYAAARQTSEMQKAAVDQRFFSTSLPVERIVEELDEFQPDSLVCYPSTLEILAREQLAGRLHLSFDGPLSDITVGAEVLTPAVDKLARQAFGIPVQDAYGLTECLSVGRSCSRFDGIHVMSDLCIVEVVDEEGQPVPDGQPGAKLLVTNLVNQVQPTIRYEVTDVTGISTVECPCDWPFPKLMPVAGRTTDILYVDAPGGGYETISPYRFGFVLQLKGLRRFQLVQTGRNEMTLNYVPAAPGPATRERLVSDMAAGLAESGLEGRIHVSVQEVDHIPVDPRSGKLRQIASLVGPPDDLAFHAGWPNC